MTATRDRSGFTLVEMMVASSIAALAFAAIAATFIFCQRMFRITMAEAEISLMMRDIRDKLLFRAGPGLNSGLLTGKAFADNTSITNSWEDTVEGPDCIRLVWRTDNGKPGGYFFNERPQNTAAADANISWFKPNDFRLRQEWQQAVDLPVIRLNLGSPEAEDVHQYGWILLPQ